MVSKFVNCVYAFFRLEQAGGNKFESQREFIEGYGTVC